MSGPQRAPGASDDATTLIRDHIRALARAVDTRDRAAARGSYDATLGAGLAPRRLLEGAAPLRRAAVVTWLQAWDDALRRLWLADDAPDEAWRELLLPRGGTFRYPMLLLHAWWLREAGSPLAGRVDAPLTPEALAAAPLAAQARLLGRFTTRADAAVACDYGALTRALDPALRPWLAAWGASVCLLSPWNHLDQSVFDRRRQLLAAFAHAPPPTPVDFPLASYATFRAAYLAPAPRAFVEAAGRAFAAGPVPPTSRATPSGPPGKRRKRRKRRRENHADKGARRPAHPEVGIVLTHWRAGHAIERCIGPLVAQLRGPAVSVYYVGGDEAEARRTFSPRWFAQGWRFTALGPARGLDALRAVARRIRADAPDLLYYPEVGLSPASRWLAAHRLARVQATGYGHPVTSGSPEVDYFVGGALVDGDPDAPTRYTERLVLLPGLGVGTAPPPRPGDHAPEEDAPPRLVSLASADKLTPALLSAWRAILERTPARLQLAPGLGPQRTQALSEALARALGPAAERVDLFRALPRQLAVDLAARADALLDSYPFGGFNTLVEALAAGRPVVSLRGADARTRFGPALVSLLDLPPELAPASEAGYVQAAARLATDASFAAAVRARLDDHDVVAAINTPIEGTFVEAVARMRRQGARPGPGPALAVG